MKLFGLIGHPLAHSRSKEYFQKKFEEEHFIDCDYRLFEFENLNSFPEFIQNTPELKGLNVTIPFKQNILNYLNEIDPTAKKVGAVNCIKIVRDGNELLIKGYNTDAFGLETSLRPLLGSRHQKAMILGTGGSSKATSFILDKLGIEFIFVSRNPLHSNQISYDELNKGIIEDHSLIINTSPAGMYPNINVAPTIPYQYLTKDHLLFDLVYNPLETLFLKKGKEKGATIKNGLEMLYLQADRSWEIWNS